MVFLRTFPGIAFLRFVGPNNGLEETKRPNASPLYEQSLIEILIGAAIIPVKELSIRGNTPKP